MSNSHASMSPPVPGHQSVADYFGPAPLLEGSLFPGGISGASYGEASRSLKGRIVREESWATDSGDQPAPIPFHVRENTYTISMIQPGSAHRPAVFLVTERESMTFNRERDPKDPRVIHKLDLEHDKFGNLLRSVSVAYGRTTAEHSDAVTASIQGHTHVVYSESEYTNDIDLDDTHVVPQQWKTREYHLTGVNPAGDLGRFTINQFQEFDFRVLDIDAEEIPFEATPTPTSDIQKRLIAGSNALYLKNDLVGMLGQGVIESLMLPGMSFKLALTPGLVAAVYQGPIKPPFANTASILSRDGGYVEMEGSWWIPSGKQGFGPLASTLAAVRDDFFTYKQFTDQFLQTTTIEYDEYDLLPNKITDPLGNIISTVNNYVHMQPKCITDINGNQMEVVQNPLGEVVGTAARGRVGEAVGDSLDNFNWAVADSQLAALLGKPGGGIAEELLGTASTRTITCYNHSARMTEPSFRVTISRQTHASDTTSPAALSKPLISVTYFDGLGREIQVKTHADQGMIQAKYDGEIYVKIEADQGVTKAANQANRWHCSGWTVWNNRGLAVRQYEPFFDSSHEFMYGKKEGESSATCFYDYLGRPVSTFSPDGTWTKVIHDSWKTTTYDASDLMKFDPGADPDVAKFYKGWKREYPDWETWYWARTKVGTLMTPLEKAAAARTEPHHDTPTVTHLDSLGREVTKVESNGQSLFYTTRQEFDIVGNVRAVIDAQDRQIVSVAFDMTGQVLHNSTMDFGQEWVLYDVAGKPLLRFQDQDIRIRTEYDALRRPTGHFHLSRSGHETQFEKVVYGDEHVPAEHNARGRIYQQYDQSGVVTTKYDFKGNVVTTERQLAQEYKLDIDWSSTTPPALEREKFINRTSFDAVNRPTELSSDGSRTRNNYNSRSLISSVETLSLSPPPTVAIPTPPPSWVPVITSIEYDAIGRKTCISYGNNTRTEFTYDKHSLRLMRARTRTVDKKSTRQDLLYTYDPRGNITHIDDKAQPDIDGVSASKDYTYDPINRLIESSGRKDMATEGAKHALVKYTEKYSYDSTGNILSIRCSYGEGKYPGRTKKYHYNTAMSIHEGKFTNRLSEIEVGGKTESFVYDAHGNVISMAGFSVMQWDFQNQLRKTSRQVIEETKLPETTYYVYGADGNRVRKVTERKADSDQQPARLYDTFYLGGLEIFRKYPGNRATWSLERKTTSIGSETPIRRVETQRWGASTAVRDTPIFRYQLPDHLGSVALELDNVGDVLSYEEYSAYGETTYQATPNIPKPYRFSGKEQDSETGLYYFGARYYAASVGRWISPDPIGIGDGPNVYCYVRCNPVSFVDPDGKALAGAGGPGSNDHEHWLLTLPGSNIDQAEASPDPEAKYDQLYKTYKYHERVLKNQFGVKYDNHNNWRTVRVNRSEFVANPREREERFTAPHILHRSNSEKIRMMRHIYESVHLSLLLSKIL